MQNHQIEKQIFKFLETLPPKQRAQIAIKILELFNNPRPHDSILLKGAKEDFRVDIGEYRVIYSFNPTAGIKILKVDKRNDGQVYR
jgi:mRNA-degrading endonuclease RelE of RelBE toxin-antitoxin system